MMESLKKTEKTRLRRSPKQAVFDRNKLYEIFDEAHVAHVGFSDAGQVFVIPMLAWRHENRLFIHGSNGSRMVKALCGGQHCSVTATLLDGMVLAKSAFHHSSNYRSAMILGSFYVIDDPAEVDHALKVFMEHIAPGRWDEVREPNAKELAATTILAIDIEEASVKVRTGGPNEDPEDLDREVWSGELQMRQKVGVMVPDEHSAMATPNYTAAWGDRWDEHC